MNKPISIFLVLISSLSGVVAHASQGEYWEVTSKMEMEGMPFAMPAQVIKVCVPKGQEMDPRKANKGKECQFSDYKANGNKVSYKFRCEEKDGVMTGDAEYTLGKNKSEGVMHMSGKASGRDMKMTQTSSSKLVGGSCDPEEIARENEERNNKFKHEDEERRKAACDTSAYTTAMWIQNSWKFLNGNTSCPPGNQKKQMCDAINKDAVRDPDIYQKIVHNDDLIKACGLNMVATTKAICKTLGEKNYNVLAGYCPAEAKTFRVAQRRKECEGRSYTAATRAEDMKKCLSGDDSGADTDNGRAYTAKARNETSGGGTQNSSSSKDAPAGDLSSKDILNGAKKLKGLFGL